MKTKPHSKLIWLVLLTSLGLMLAGPLVAQTFTTLHSFTATSGNNSTNSDGANPEFALLLSGNTLYGTATAGGTGANGTVFAVNTNGSSFTNLHSFDDSDGSDPHALVLSGNTLYGIANGGGSGYSGTVFAINTNGTGFTNLHIFGVNSGSYPFATNSDGVYPSPIILSGNILYGAAIEGGSSGYGVVFALNTNTMVITNLHIFTNGTDGSNPFGLILAGNTLYGVANGTTSGNGSLFRINTNGTGFTNLWSFPATNFTNYTDDIPPNVPFIPLPNSNGFGPTSLILSGSTLYGTTYYGGSSGNGTVFAINTNAGGFTNLHGFAATSGPNLTNGEGSHPIAASGLVLSGNTLYGTTPWGGVDGNGTVFAINTNGTGFAVLHTFTALSGPNATNSDGASPVAGLIMSGNTLFGTTYYGGTNGQGTVFSLSLQTPPELTITLAGTNMVLTWPTNATGFALQATTNLVSTNWSNVSPAPTVVNGRNTVTNAISGKQLFYRLSQ